MDIDERNQQNPFINYNAYRNNISINSHSNAHMHKQNISPCAPHISNLSDEHSVRSTKSEYKRSKNEENVSITQLLNTAKTENALLRKEVKDKSVQLNINIQQLQHLQNEQQLKRMSEQSKKEQNMFESKIQQLKHQNSLLEMQKLQTGKPKWKKRRYHYGKKRRSRNSKNAQRRIKEKKAKKAKKAKEYPITHNPSLIEFEEYFIDKHGADETIPETLAITPYYMPFCEIPMQYRWPKVVLYFDQKPISRNAKKRKNEKKSETKSETESDTDINSTKMENKVSTTSDILDGKRDDEESEAAFLLKMNRDRDHRRYYSGKNDSCSRDGSDYYRDRQSLKRDYEKPVTSLVDHQKRSGGRNIEYGGNECNENRSRSRNRKSSGDDDHQHRSAIERNANEHDANVVKRLPKLTTSFRW